MQRSRRESSGRNQLTSLDHSIRVGNSVVDDATVDLAAFDWRRHFPEVFQAGGFDVVIANPPYIRQEWLVRFKPHWEQRFRSYSGTADIFTYFFELGVDLLREGGRLGYITSGTWEVALADWQRQHTALTESLIACEQQINDRVYRLFCLSPTDIRFLDDHAHHAMIDYPYGQP